MGLPSASGRLADLSHALRHARGFPERLKAPNTEMKRSRTARILLALFFVGLLAVPVAIKRWSAHRDANAANMDAGSAMSRYGFHLEEVSAASGIKFVHQ